MNLKNAETYWLYKSINNGPAQYDIMICWHFHKALWILIYGV